MLHELTAGEAGLLVVLFPHLAGLNLVHVEDLGAGVRITARTRTASLACRGCGAVSAQVHDRYERRLADLACGGRPVQVVLEVRRFCCGSPACPVATFAEQVPGLTGWYQRRTAGLRDLLEKVALALAGRAGSRLAAALGAVVSRFTLIRLVRGLPDPQAGPVAVLGVDDVAKRKGHSYATVLMDMDRHRLTGMLPDREADTFADWLRAHPGTEVICRDRGGAYARAAREAAPAAVQVADRFHLWQDLAEAVEKTVLACLAAMDPPPGPDSPRDPDAPASPDAPAPAEPDGFRDVHGHERRLVARHRDRYAAVQALRAGGCSVREIARRLGLARNTAQKFASAASIDELLVKATSRPSILDPFKPYLNQRWNQGITSAAALHEEIRARGWTGDIQAVQRYLRQFRTADGRDRQARARPQLTAPPAPAPPKPRQVTRWIMTHPDHLASDDAAALARLLDASPALAAAAGHVRSFASMMTRRQGLLALEDWLTAVEAGNQPGLHSFARGIRRDQQAVTAGLALPYSSGALEGKNCKIKYLKRLMYGRANFDLLRKMALLN
ncbi:MAG TPA: ISL3 family transposase [Streptosporangiaceae bacterium]|nr:ISL3 family transposase [Streptosporangiaceae bacterium]